MQEENGYILCPKLVVRPQKIKVFGRPGGVYYLASLGMHTGATIKDLFYQLILGGDHLINPTLWYLYDTAIIMMLFMAIQRSDKKVYTWLRIILMVLCIVLQYSGINYDLFFKLPSDIHYSLGRIVEMIPAACVGSLLFDVLQKKRITVALSASHGIPALIIGSTMFWGSYYIPKMDIKGFGYQGLFILVGVILLTGGFYGLNVPNHLKRPIAFVQQYGLGIYCIHMAVGKVAELVAQKVLIPTGNLVICFLIWSACIAGCVAIDMFTKKKC
ncbi:MAG: hypothetical protein SPL23_09715 [Lachnospiraceae bacterium]|nr:hypothetical protein [Lachnospiraceae bacterium]